MEVLIVLIIISIILAGGFLVVFFFAVRNNQFKDTYTPSIRILFDDNENLKL